MNIKIASVDSVIIYFGEVISKKTSLLIKSAYKILHEKNIEGIIELIPSYTTLYIRYDIFTFDYQTIKVFLMQELANLQPLNEKNSKLITIDVYYGQEVGFDLERVSKNSQLSIDEVIKLHSNVIYDVYAIGFLPGFAYLASVNEKINVARLTTPRKTTPKGSVAIANNQTAIYPQNSPGGWNILGRTAFELIDKQQETLTALSIDCKIKFNPIGKEEFLHQGGVL